MTSNPRFQRRIENFTCFHCGAAVRGNGYTDHCPACLWSLHVDTTPGDRASTCRGPMRPTQVLFGDPARIVYECETCHLAHTVRSVRADSFDTMLKIAREASEAPPNHRS